MTVFPTVPEMALYHRIRREPMYRVFTRTWWTPNPTWPDGLEPCPGRKTTIGKAHSEADAREMCRQYNETHKPGRLSRKAEYEEIE